MISLHIRARQVAPPVIPVNAATHGGEYTDSICRGGFPQHAPLRGRTATRDPGNRVLCPPPAPAVSPAPTPLVARPSAERIDSTSFLSGGASGENSALCGGCWLRGRSAVGSNVPTRTSA